MKNGIIRLPTRQNGAITLPISLILLILLTLITVYAARVGVLETRTSSNKQRAEQAFSATEAAVEQTASFISYNFERVLSTDTNGWMNAGSAVKWSACPENDDELPCSSADDRTSWLVIKNVPSLTLTSCTDKDSDNTGAVDNIPDGLCDSDATLISKSVGDALYVHLMTRCRDANNDKTCDDATARPADYPFITVVANGESADQTGKSMVMQTIFFYDNGSGTAGAPAPLVAAGSVTGGGNFNIVVNPDVKKDTVGSMASNKLSIWSNADVVVGSSSATCYEGESGVNGYLETATGNNLPTYTKANYVPTNNQVVIIQDYYSNGEDLYLCRSCTCPNDTKDGAISLNGGTEEDDILDIDSDTGKWLDTTFPSDLFRMFTGTPETDWQSFKQSLASQGRLITNCAALDHNSIGWYWLEGDCSLTGGNDDVGGPNNPVRVIIQGNLDIRSNIYVWGVFFAFSPTHATLNVSLNGSPTFYGALLSNTSLNLSNGSYKARYLPNLLSDDPDSLNDSGFARLPGSWKDY